MADKPEDGPSLEMPSLSLRRQRKPEPAAAGRRPIDVGGLPAAALTGLLVGALAVAIAWLVATACDAVRGTSSCGGAAGLPLLLATFVVLAYAGSLLLRRLGVADAGSTSLLAVGVLAVLVMVFLLGSLDEWWALAAVPVASIVAYVGSWWLTRSAASVEAR